MWTAKADLRRELYRRYAFQECVIEDVRWADHGATIEIVFRYLWADDDGWYLTEGATSAMRRGTLRPDSYELRQITFSGVQELALRNALAPEQLQQPDLLDWGISEIAAVRLEDHDLLLGRYPYSPELHHVSITFESNRRLDVVFRALDIAPVTPSNA